MSSVKKELSLKVVKLTIEVLTDRVRPRVIVESVDLGPSAFAHIVHHVLHEESLVLNRMSRAVEVLVPFPSSSRA